MEDAKKKVRELLALGDSFTYANFSKKGEYGYPEALDPAWISWTARVDGAIRSLFGPDSASANLIKEAQSVSLIGWEEGHFDQAKAYYMASLRNAGDALASDVFGELAVRDTAVGPLAKSNKVFIVHGRDDKAKTELEVILKEMGLETIVLHRQPDGGKTVIEKFEQFADVGFAFVLMTPDEIAYLVDESGKDDADRKKEYRARPNVIFEFGYFVGRLGRSKTCCILKGDVTVPSDLNGLVYKRYNNSIEEIAYSITKELKEIGYKLK